MQNGSGFEKYRCYRLENDCLQLSTMDLGATVTSLRFHGREMVLGYARAETYRERDAYLGAVIGRCANRIAGASFSLGGEIFRLSANEGSKQLHGGPEAFDRRVWTGEATNQQLRFFLSSPDGDNGYPGNLQAAVTYRLDGACLRMDFEAICDRDTVYAPTSHLYFDLSGRGRALEASLQIQADRYVEVDEELLPTGRLLPTRGRYDFRRLRPIGEDYDHCFVLDGQDCCRLEDGGVALEIRTDFPGVQIYTGRFLPPPHHANSGVAIEPCFFPDSPNQPGFPSVLLPKERRFHRWIEYHFRKTQ